MGTTLLRFIIPILTLSLLSLPSWVQAIPTPFDGVQKTLRLNMDWDDDIRTIEVQTGDLLVLTFWKKAWRDEITMSPLASLDSDCSVLQTNEYMGRKDFVVRIHKIKPNGSCRYNFYLMNFQNREKSTSLVSFVQWE